jgi:4-carboxymuconolactone decarboxylase
MIERMPPLDPARMNDAQKKAAAELTAGPRKGVFGPFIPLLRSPELMDRLGRVGEHLRFNNSIATHLNELAILITARHVTNQFEWVLHHPLAVKGGVAPDTLAAIAKGKRPTAMARDEAIVHDFATELLRTHFVSDATYARALERFGEQGVVDLTGTIGYFVAVCYMMNVAGTPPPRSEVSLLEPARP